VSYQDLIIRATGCPPADAPEIEEIMRQDIFHSTLDWQTREQLEEAAVLGQEVLVALRNGSFQ